MGNFMLLLVVSGKQSHNNIMYYTNYNPHQNEAYK